MLSGIHPTKLHELELAVDRIDSSTILKDNCPL